MTQSNSMHKEKEASKPSLPMFSKSGGDPLVFMWIAHYENGTSLPQFNPKTLKQNHFRDVDVDNVIKFGLYPFSPSLAYKLREKGIDVESNPFLPKYEINIDGDKRLIGAVARNWVKTSKKHYCKQCNKKFDINKDVDYVKSKYSSPICPYCGGHDYWVCRKCGAKIDKWEDFTIPGFFCPECGSRNKKHEVITSQLSYEQDRWRLYILGYQQTIDGKNYKTLLYISENGDVEVKYE